MDREECLVATLPPRPSSAGVARALVHRKLTDWHEDRLCDAAALVITELVANAVRHARTELQLRIVHLVNGVRLELADGSRLLPQPRRARRTDETGRGLELVGALSSRHGVDGDARGKRVWAELT